MDKRLIILSAPSGAGKTTVARHLLSRFPQLRFSVSATTRPQRPTEQHGVDYYFLSRDQFEQCILEGDLIEYEEIFGNLYGTLKSQVQESLDRQEFLLFDIDVKGALSLRTAFPNDTLLVFVAPPSIEILEQRLRNRNTESEEQLELRLDRVRMEMTLQDQFDVVIVNDDLAQTLESANELIEKSMR